MNNNPYVKLGQRIMWSAGNYAVREWLQWIEAATIAGVLKIEE